VTVASAFPEAEDLFKAGSEDLLIFGGSNESGQQFNEIAVENLVHGDVLELVQH
jgi:hypothetical protein